MSQPKDEVLDREMIREGNPPPPHKDEIKLDTKDIQTMNHYHLEEALDIVNDQDTTRSDKNKEISKLLHRATCSGDSETVKALLDHQDISDYINVNAKDEEGSAPIIYAACFGYAEVVQSLVSSGSQVDIQDLNGWSPLMWATSNNHKEIVKILLQNGASPSTKNSKGRTILDIINHGLTNTEKHEKKAKLKEILTYNHRTTKSLGSLFPKSSNSLDDDNISVNSFISTDPDAEDDDDDFMKICQEQLLGEKKEPSSKSVNHGFSEETLHEYTNEDFNWDQCLPDQMFVFSENLIPHIVGTVVTTMKPIHQKDQAFLPADVLFLCSRFAFYYNTSDLLNELLESAFKAIRNCVKANYNQPRYLSFWLANCSQLLFYFKKDAGLAESAIEHQLSLSELLHEIYHLKVRETQSKIEPELSYSILESNTIPGLVEDYTFKDDLKKFFLFSKPRDDDYANVSFGRSPLRQRLSLRRRPRSNSKDYIRKTVANPKNVTGILSNALKNLKVYQVHPILINHFLNQLVYYITSELFNRILDTRHLCCRTRAMQIRMNITVLEDWIRQNSSSDLMTILSLHFKPLLHLIQLLQCFSSHKSLSEFQETLESLDTLTPLQIQLVAETYRYEKDEESISCGIMDCIQSKADDVIERKYRSIDAVKDGKTIVVLHNPTKAQERISNRVSFLGPNSESKPTSRLHSGTNSSPVSESNSAPPCIIDKEICHEESETASSLDHNSTPSMLSSPTEISDKLNPTKSPYDNLMSIFQYSDFLLFKDPNHMLPFSNPTDSSSALECPTLEDPASGYKSSDSSSNSTCSHESLIPYSTHCYVPKIPEKVVDLLDVKNARTHSITPLLP